MTECDIYSVNGRKFHTERAVWDTGADTIIISSRIVKELNLQPIRLVASVASVVPPVPMSISYTCLFPRAIS